MVRLPVGSEVPSTVCTFRYIRPTGQTVTETPGERVDSQTVQTITPGQLRRFSAMSYVDGCVYSLATCR